MKLICVTTLALVCALQAVAQEAQPVPLWTGAAPGALGTEDKDIPTLTPYLAASAKATSACVVICPGGGYGGLAGHEGKDYALWLNAQGIAGFVSGRAPGLDTVR